MSKLCPFCHTWCSDNIYDQHIAGHMQRAADGQMQDHVTVQPDQRFAGDIAKEPRWYVHPRCGGVTGMPDEIIRSYMVDPFLYNESSFCTGCHNYVPTGELFWQETNESLLASSYRRKAEFIQKNALNPDDFIWDANGPTRRKNRASGGGSGEGVLAVVAIGGIAAVLLLGFVGLLGFLSLKAQAARRPVPPPINAGLPAFNPAFQPGKFPDMAPVEIPHGPDMEKIMRESNERMEEMSRRHEEMIEQLKNGPFGGPGGIGAPPVGVVPDLGSPAFGPPDLGAPPALGPGGGIGGIEDARKRSEDAHQRAQERINAIRERMKNRP